MSLKHFLLPALFLAASSVSHASTLLFTMSGLENGTFYLSSTPTPDGVNLSVGDDTDFFAIAVTNSTYGSPLGFVFYGAPDGGGFADSGDVNGFYGAQIFTGPTSAPVFAPGVFFLSSQQNGPSDETLTITAVPEPSSLTLLFSGLGTVGATVLRRRRLTHTDAA